MQAGIEHIVFVTGRNKQAIEDHFDDVPELISSLTRSGKNAQLSELAQMLPTAGSVSFTRQQAPLGLGHAVWCARDVIGKEPFAVLLPDVLVKNRPGCLKQMVEAAGGLDKRANILAVEEVPAESVHMYGIVGIGKRAGRSFEINGMIEKPSREKAPSNLSITGRYILQPEIFDVLADQEHGAGGEIQLTDAMIRLAKTQPFFGLQFEGRSFDCGSKPGFLAANIAYGMDRADLAPILREEMALYFKGKKEK